MIFRKSLLFTFLNRYLNKNSTWLKSRLSRKVDIFFAYFIKFEFPANTVTNLLKFPESQHNIGTHVFKTDTFLLPIRLIYQIDWYDVEIRGLS